MLSDLEKAEADLRARRDNIISRAAALLDGEASALDAQIAEAAARVEAAKAEERAEQERVLTTALNEAVTSFCTQVARLEEAFEKAVASTAREDAASEVRNAITSLQASLRPRQVHSRTYTFKDAERTIVRRNDGQSFLWPPGENIGNVGGRVAEQFRLDGCPLKR
jgi:hypothetical protein